MSTSKGKREKSKSRKSKPAASPDSLIKPSDRAKVELSEDELGRVSGGMISNKLKLK